MLGPSGASSCGSASKAMRCPETQSRAGTFGARALNFGTLEGQSPATLLRPAFFMRNPADAGERSASQLLAEKKR